MKMFHSNAKYGLVLMLVLALVLQIAGPIVSQVYANEEIGHGGVNQELEASQDEGLLEDSQDEELVKDSEEIESQRAIDESLEPEDGEQPPEDNQKPGNLEQEEKVQNMEVLKRNQENIVKISPLDEGGGRDLGNIFTFESFKLGDPGVAANLEQPVTVEDGTIIELVYNWSTEGKPVVDGSTAKIAIPEAFKRAGKDGSFENLVIKLTGGEEVGKYSIIGGEIVFTFDQRMVEYIEKGGAVTNGKVGFQVEFNEEIFEMDIVQEVKFNDTSNKTMIVISKPNEIVSGLNKTVKTVPKDAKEINWTLDIINPGPEKMTDAKISDQLPEGLTIESSDIKIYDLTVGSDGEAHKGSETSEKTVTVTDRKFEIPLGDIEAYKGYRVKYITKIVDITTSNQTFTNNAQLIYVEGETLEAKATTNAIERSNIIEKKGSQVVKDNIKLDKIEWTIDINKGGGTINNAVVYDALPAGLTLNGKAILYKVVDGVNTEAKEFESISEMNLGNLGTDHYRIIFQTDIDYSQVNGGDYKESHTFTNSVSIKDGGTEIGNVSADVPIERELILTKEGHGDIGYDYDNKKIEWKVHVNKANHSIKGATVTDILPAGLTINASDIKVNGMKLDEDKIMIDITNGGINDGRTKIIMKLGDIKEYKKIEYFTKINEDSLTEDRFTNEVKLTGLGEGNGIGTGTLDAEKEAKATPTLTKNTYNKIFVKNDYDKKTIDWEVTIEPKRDAIKSLKIEDTFPNKGLILDPTTLAVKLGENKLDKDIHYTLTPRTEVVNGNDVTGYQKGFIIEFIGYDDTKLLNDTITITYTTYYDPDKVVDGNKIDANTGTDKEDKNNYKIYKNTATFEGETKNGHDIGGSKTAQKQVIDSSWNNGYKIGYLKSIDSDGDLIDGWHSGNERRIQWEVYTNYLKLDLGTGVTVTDKMNYKGNISDIEVKTYTVDPITGNTVLGSIIDANLYDVTDKMDEGFKLTFKENVNERYVIIFNTSVPDISKGKGDYTNEAILKDSKDKEYPYEASTGFSNANKHVTKKSLGEAVVDQELNWEIKINESLSKIEKDVKIVDTLSAGLAYKPDSLKLYRMDGAKKTKVEEGIDKYYTLKVVELEDGTTELTIKFKESVKSTYQIEYTTVVIAKKGDEVNNKVTYSGTNLDEKSETTEVLTAKQYSWTEGSNNPDYGLIRLTKQDENEKIIKNLPAEFKLEYSLTEDGKRYLFGDGIFSTNNDGELKIGNLPLNRYYYLTETKAPIGHLIGENQGKEKWSKFMVVNKADTPYKFNINNTKIKGNIEFTKLGEDVLEGLDPIRLEGAEFTLYDKEGTNPIKDGSGNNIVATSNTEGKVLFENISYGKYTIKETKSTGYILSERVLNVTIKEDGVTVIPTEKKDGENKVVEKFQNTIKRAHIKLKKVDTSDRPLKGAEFTLYKEDGTTIVKDKDGKALIAISDENGDIVFENIAYGKYKIKESKAPAGYYSSNKVIEVCVKEDGVAVVKDINGEDLIIKNYKIPSTPLGTLELVKQGEDGESLSGAIFELVQNGLVKYTSQATGKDGRVVFQNIPFGKYLVREKQAPIGYKLEKKDIEVDIDKAGEVIELLVINSRLKGQIELIKEDVYGKPLEGAEFGLYDLEGKLVGAKVMSDKEGNVRFGKVAFGDYTIKETKAPDGYKLNDKEFKISVKEEATLLKDIEGKQLKLVNKELGRIKITKTDKINKSKLLQGAIFEVRDSKGDLVEELTTDKRGIAIARNLEYGSYTVVEIKAPKGYLLDNTKYTVKVDDSNAWKNIEAQLVIGNMIDPEKPVNPDDSGSNEQTDPDDPDNPDENEPTGPINPNDPNNPNKPGNPTDPSTPGYTEGDLVQTGTDINMLIPIGLIIILIGVAYIFKNKSIKE